jgi:molybdate transport system substrate-binding protein
MQAPDIVPRMAPLSTAMIQLPPSATRASTSLATLNIFSAGAAQAVVAQIAQNFERDTGDRVAAAYGAVGAMHARISTGEPADVIVLTAALIDDLIGKGLVVPGSRIDLGKVGTGVAVREGTALPDVRTVEALRGNIRAATRVYCPDPAVATAGKVVLGLLDRLGVAEQVKPRLHFFPNGNTAMAYLAEHGGSLDMGITQITEIIPSKGVTFVGPLPAAVQTITVYSVGLAAGSAQPDLAKAFIERLTGAPGRPLLKQAGYQLD